LSFITLLTDFGRRDGYDGIMKGVIWTILPDAQIADITHTISPQNIAEGALTLVRAAFFFPPGTVHVAVVDPGVGTSRRPIAMRLGQHTFVGPDNGLFTRVLEHAERAAWTMEMVALDRPQFWLPHVSQVFHGRDVFAPVAAHLAGGVPLREVGTPIVDPIRLALPHPHRTARGWCAQVIGIDHFGNLTTNLAAQDLTGAPPLTIAIAGAAIQGLVRAFGDRPSGDLIALIDSSGALSICVVNGSAAERLGVIPGVEFDVLFLEAE
jgi:S-adenosyl-L-methionine hydrolase (adenosine-forming)